MPRFSIVVPVYNVEPYINECLSSLQDQTFGDFEVICVDDASPDNSAAIIQLYCDKDPRFRLIRNTDNMHLFASRHIGVRETTGEYVLFVDGDDKLADNALEKLDEQLRNNPVDILQFPMKPIADPSTDITIKGDEWYCYKSKPKMLRGNEILSTICYEQAEDMCAHHRAYRGELARKTFNDLGYEPNIYSAEDIVELAAIMIAADSYQVIDSDPYYLYYVGRGLSEARSTITREAFTSGSHAKRRCYDVLTQYLDRKGLHNAGIRVPIEWRWRHSCAQTLYQWQGALPPDDRITAFEEFASLWPAAWVVPSLCTFVADEAQALASGGEAADPASLKLSFSLNMQCLGAAFMHYNTNQAFADETNTAWNSLRAGLDNTGFLSDNAVDANEEARFLLQCLRSLCLFLRNEMWTADDEANQAKFVLIEQSERISWSAALRGLISKSLSSPFRARRDSENSRS